MLIDPRAATARSDAADCRRAADLLTAWALKLQARGDEEAALDRLVTVLALSRHLRHQAPALAYLEGVEVERVALGGLEHWLTRLGRRPDLLRRALDQLTRHESEAPPVSEALATEYLRCRTALGNSTGGRLSGEMESMVMQTPWEAGRARRLVDAVFAGRRRLAEAGYVVPPSDDTQLADWLPDQGGATRERLGRLLGSSWLGGAVPVTAPLQRAAMLASCRVRAARLQVALILYQCEHGQAAPSLEALVPALLPELPDDPFAHESFRYRVSKGERIAWPRAVAAGGMEFVRDVQAGQGVLWSVGPDGSDDGGTRQWDKDAKGGTGRDVIFLVPRCEGR